ncbi:hypothetical protein MRB53_014341 [Persea americana]|uniref:Uncharacterized protein n=1 Tax=Persea americana TaxID=3435 RepID=A0ACC2KAN0_PERAE|nr:hypothetical protein MRB53_014341 [Persea americana]
MLDNPTYQEVPLVTFAAEQLEATRREHNRTLIAEFGGNNAPARSLLDRQSKGCLAHSSEGSQPLDGQITLECADAEGRQKDADIEVSNHGDKRNVYMT